MFVLNVCSEHFYMCCMQLQLTNNAAEIRISKCLFWIKINCTLVVELLKLQLIVFMDNALEICASSFSQILQLVQILQMCFIQTDIQLLLYVHRSSKYQLLPLTKMSYSKFKKKLLHSSWTRSLVAMGITTTKIHVSQHVR